MKISIVTDTSDNIKELSNITLPNKEGYSSKHGYILHCREFNYERFNEFILDHMMFTLDVMKSSDVVMTCGADVMFTNWNIKIEDVLLFNDNILIAKENTGWWPINNDVMIWRCNPRVIEFYERLINDFPVWRNYPWRTQAHLWNIKQEEPKVGSIMRLVEPEVMNQHPSKWQLGNWIIHMYNMDIKSKVAQAMAINNVITNGNPVWKVEHVNIKPQTA